MIRNRDREAGSGTRRPTRLVYTAGPDGSSTVEQRCERCRAAPCRCGPEATRDESRRPVRVRRERAGRRGKTVTTAGPLHIAREEAAELLRTLKRECGSGGTLRDSREGEGFVLEIQGDHVETLVRRLASLDFRVKRAGG